MLARKPEWNSNPVKKAVYLALRQPAGIAAGKRFERVQRQSLKLTRRYSEIEQLAEDKPAADVYMTGSDQVWGPVGDGTYDSSYCLSFTGDADKRISYAASFGRTDIAPAQEEYFKKWLSRYKHIAVREYSAVQILKGIGITAFHVVDPTLLLDPSFWDRYAKPIERSNYVLVYQIHNDKRVGAYAQKAARAMGLPLIRVSASFHQICREGKFVWCPEIGEFLSYIKNAACIITDSFHGTALAISFNTPFVEVLPNNGSATRNLEILKMTGLSNQILTEDNDVSLALREVDFSGTNKILADKRLESLEILKQMIEN